MRNFFNFIRRNWLLFLLLFIAPIIVIVLFAIAEHAFHSINLTVGEWTNIIECVFSYLGTVLLGALAFLQNDRIVQLEERNAEIQETKLMINNSPDFSIDEMILSFRDLDEKKLKVERLDDGIYYKEIYQSEVDINGDVSFLWLTIVLKNSSNVSAYNVEVYKSVLDENPKNHLYILGSNVYELIERQDIIVLSYNIHFDEITSRNGVKFVEYCFNLNYENIYHHPFYNYMNIFVGIEDNRIAAQVAIGKQHNEKKDLEPRYMVNGKSICPSKS